MLTVFRSKSGADVLMLWPHAEVVLQALGREPAHQGIFSGAQVPQALQAWAHWEAAQAAPDQDVADPDQPEEALPPALRQRAWPVCELLRAAQQQGHDVIWQPA